jgi:hypothetical protein
MAARFNASYDGIGEMIRSQFMVEAMLGKAEKVRAAAEGIARAEDIYDPAGDPHYVDQFTVTATRSGGEHHDRAVAYIGNSSDHAFFIEWGNANITKHRVLGRALHIGTVG